MQGTRHDMTENDDVLKPGEYGKHWLNAMWYCCTPDGNYGGLGNHEVTEHEDGTITVSPSILVSYAEAGKPIEQWHGYLERGIWREV